MIRVIELFSGIGAQVQALKEADIDFKSVAISEIDKYAIKTYELLHGPVYNLGDISKINIYNVPDCDLLTYSFPCQDLSCAGKQLGAEEGSGTRSALLWDCKKIIDYKRPQYLLMENVKNLVNKTHKENFDKWLNYLSSLGYTNSWAILNSKNFGLPQNRERVIAISILGENKFNFPNNYTTTPVLENFLEKNVEEKYFTSYLYNGEENNMICALRGRYDKNGKIVQKLELQKSGLTNTLTTVLKDNLLITNGRIRKLTPKEYWRLMGFRDELFEKVNGKVSNTQLYKQAGNSICVPVLKEIFIKLFK